MLSCSAVVRIVPSAKHHEHIPSLTLKERELERLKRERERKEGGLTGERRTDGGWLDRYCLTHKRLNSLHFRHHNAVGRLLSDPALLHKPRCVILHPVHALSPHLGRNVSSNE